MIVLAIAKTANMDKNVFFRLNLENRLGMNSPHTAIVNVKELTYSPDTATVVLKYSLICLIIPTMLNGVLMPIVDSINMYKSIFGL